MFNETFSMSQNNSYLEHEKIYELKGNLFNPNKIIHKNNWNNRLMKRLDTYYNLHNQKLSLKKSTKY